MVPAVFSLYQFSGGVNASYPFSIEDYQRYVFGDDKRAHQFGTDLAKAFIANALVNPSNQSFTNDIAVAVLSECIPTATHSLRKHFVAYLNRYLISLSGRPALKIDVYYVGKNVSVRTAPGDKSKGLYHIDSMRLAGRPLIVLADVRMTQDREEQITESLRNLKIDSSITFVYIAAMEGPLETAGLSPLMASIISPSIKDIETIAQAANFTMNESFVHFILGRDYGGFCSFVRRQDDCLVRLLLDYAIEGSYFQNDDHRQNFEFLQWEVEARDSV